MRIEAEAGVSRIDAEKATASASSILIEKKLNPDLYRAVVSRFDGRTSVCFIDKDYVYQRGHRGSCGKVPNLSVAVNDGDFAVIGHNFVR